MIAISMEIPLKFEATLTLIHSGSHSGKIPVSPDFT